MKLRVSQEGVREYLGQVRETYGDLQELQPASQPWQATSGESGDLVITGRFTGATADIRVALAVSGFSPEIDNITVGDLVLAPEQ